MSISYAEMYTFDSFEEIVERMLQMRRMANRERGEASKDDDDFKVRR